MTDVAVVGGGLVGLAAAVALAGAGLDTLHLAPAARPDRRTSALMGPTVGWMRENGLIGDPAAIGHPLTAIRIIDATDRLLRAPETLFRADEAGLEAFGWNLPNAVLTEAFVAAGATRPNLRRLDAAVAGLRREDTTWRLSLADGSTVSAPLVVGADGKGSTVRAAAGIRTREHKFPEAALVADLELGRALGGTSVEFHYPRGPFTLVPAGGNRANLVWIDDRNALEDAQRSGREELGEAAWRKSQRLFGKVRVVSPSVVFPLGALTVETAGRDGIVLVGEAAHAFPPIGAQGLNLGLRDVADLSIAVRQVSMGTHRLGDEVSRAYAASRAGDLARTGLMVDALFRSLLSPMLPAQVLRAAGLWALRLQPGLRRRAFALGVGGRPA
jgi:2-octaprenyl-6-methoxyphenol hydroxylase